MKPVLSQLVRALSAIRYVSLLGVFSCAIGSVVMFIIGAKKTLSGITIVLTNKLPAGSDPGLDLSAAVTTSLFSALDAFLFGIVMLYSAYGIFSLFVMNDSAETKEHLPRNLVPTSLSQLKHQIAMVVVVLLFVLFLELAWSSLSGLHGKTWELLVIPGAIFLLAASLRLLMPPSEHND